MSQEEIILVLKKTDATAGDLVKLTNLSRSVINRALRQLLKYGEINFYISDGIPIYYEGCKIKKRRKILPKK